ncbi:MAG: trypsin-like peptidase domain-containing protein [Planctomycetaceae bacterium]|nr:trypsin-like peptidase domain-containing protein [Planctomycetaceae bacterium]
MTTKLSPLLFFLTILAAPAWGPLQADENESPAIPAQQDVSELTERVKESLVVVTFSGRDGKQEGLGSGFIIDADGLIATNMHVIGEARPIQVRLQDGRKFDVQTILASDRHLDLAVLKIDASDLPALQLGDSDAVKQGTPAIALGNPRGFRFSVVGGVISGIREIDEKPLMQLGMLIEQGNSGGPVIDYDGKVQGIVALKSLAEKNVAFAVPINELKPLLENPNPIPMKRWLTIGVLDESEWNTLFGSTWNQRAGRILVKGRGEGFGGRSIALSKQEVPQPPYEVEVAVRMDDEGGAAGLVFESDGDTRHFGFYPSNESMRLTRFDGRDVFSWTVLQELQTAAYKPGEFNTFKVRVEQDKILCYVNDRQVIEQTGETLRTGRVGLVKFRDTVAEFKNFRLGKELPSLRPSPEVVARLKTDLDGIDLTRTPPRAVAKRFLEEQHAGAVMAQRADELEAEAERLRQLAQDVHVQKVIERLKTLLEVPDEEVDLIRAGLLIARIDNPELRVEPYLHEVNQMANQIKASFPENPTDKQKLESLDKYLFEELGYHGSRHDYYNSSNSYLNEVIDDREGLPITLSVLYMELAKRLELPVVGVGLPTHFIVRYEPDEGESQLIDPFHKGKRMSQKEAEQLVLQNTGRPFDEQDLATSGNREIIERMLNNLFGIARNSEDPDAMRRYTEALVIIAPEADHYLWFRAVLNYQTQRETDALKDIEMLLERPNLEVDREQVRQLREVLKKSKVSR